MRIFVISCWGDGKDGSELSDALRGAGHRVVYGEPSGRVFEACEAGVLVLPAGVGEHFAAGYLAGRRKPVFVLDRTHFVKQMNYELLDKVGTTLGELVLWADILERQKNDLPPQA